MSLRARLKAGFYMVSLAFYACMAQAESRHTLHIYTENYPPYNMSLSGEPFAHNKEDIEGVCTDIVVALLAHTDIPYRIKLRNWSMGLSRAKHKQNTGLYCAAKTVDRESYFHWIGPLAHIDWTLFAKSGSTIKLNKLEDAKKYKIGGYKGDVMTNYLVEQGYNVIVMPDESLNPRKLELGQIDLWITDGLTGPYVASEADVSGVTPVLTFRKTPLYLAINKDTDPSIISKLDSTFRFMLDSGEAESILHTYIK